MALKEVWSHFTTTQAYPAYTAQVPDDRCAACHETVSDSAPPLAGFTHTEHASAGECQGCHPSTGHAVTFGALGEAGILDPAYANQPTDAPTGQLLFADAKPGLPPGHTDVTCRECHAMVAAGCGYCHEKPAEHLESDLPCAQCHKPGATFKGAKFDHSGAQDCADCHQPPANHYPGAKCASCHKASVAFKKTVFRHSGNTGEHSFRNFPCADCHPKGYGSASCAKCHKGGVPQDD